MKDKYTVLSLFSGAGGLDLGFHEQGYKILCASDNWVESKDTFKLNFPNIPFICEDVRKLSIDSIKKEIGRSKVDVIIGGPPCQGFSAMGDKNSADPRNLLFESYAEIVKHIKPKCFVFENVKGLKTMFGGRYLASIINTFTNLGYNVYEKTLNAKDFGVPQSRERVIIFATLSDNLFDFTVAKVSKVSKLKQYSNCGDAINDLINNTSMPNHIALNHGDKVIRRYKYIKPGGKLPPPEELPEDIRRKNFGNTYVRLDPSKVSPTMVPGNNAFPIHPSLHRSLTPREAARIQSFPDSFIFSGSRKEQCKLVGNSVPPLMASCIAKMTSNHLNNKTKTSANSFYKKYTVIEKNQKKKTKKQQLNFVDLFSGAGGITTGFIRAGLNAVFCADFYKPSSETHEKNFPNIPFVYGDLSDAKIYKEIKAKYGKENIDVMVGGPPCQGFSIFGKRRFIKSKDYKPTNDKRNDLIFTYLKYVELFKPKWFLMENVPGLITLDDGWFIKSLLKSIEKLGYKNCEYKVVNMADYGVPQTRKRFILIANRINHIIPWPKPKYFSKPEDWQIPYRTVFEVLSNLSPKSSQSKYENHIPMKHADEVIERFSFIKEGKKLDPSVLPERLKYSKTGKAISSYSKVFFRLHKDQPSPTLVPGHSAFPIHPWLNRQITIREAARIQTFPDDFKFLGGSGEQCTQVGNAFPPLAAETFANFFIKSMDNNWSNEALVSNLARYSLIDKDK